MCRAREQQGGDLNPGLSAPMPSPSTLNSSQSQCISQPQWWGQVSISSPPPTQPPAQECRCGRLGEGLRNIHLAPLPKAMLGQGVGAIGGEPCFLSFSQGHLCLLCLPLPIRLSFLICDVRGWARSKVISKVTLDLYRVP